MVRQISEEDSSVSSDEGGRFCLGKVRVTNLLTGEMRRFFFAALTRGDHDLFCGVKNVSEDEDYGAFCQSFGSSAQLDDKFKVEKYFGYNLFSFHNILKDPRVHLVSQVISGETRDIERSVSEIVTKYQNLFTFLGENEVVMPEVVSSVVQIVLNSMLSQEFSKDSPDLLRIRKCVEQANRWGVRTDLQRICYAASHWLIQRMHGLNSMFPQMANRASLKPLIASAECVQLLETIVSVLNLILGEYKWDLSLSESQNLFYHIVRSRKLGDFAGSKLEGGTEKLCLELGRLLKFSDKVLFGHESRS
jgi:hypothetical protein